MPHFLVIGAAKSGTTALCRLLRRHPQILLPRHTDAHFLLWERGPRPGYRGPGDDNLSRPAVTKRSAYEMLFAEAGDQPVRGEGSVFYLYVPGTAKRIASALPTVRLNALLRSPAQRELSAHQHLARQHRITKSFARVVHGTLRRCARPTRALVPARARTWLLTRPPGGVLRDVARKLVERFRPDVRALEELLQRDLSSWLSVS
jgi:hypothetical protein